MSFSVRIINDNDKITFDTSDNVFIMQIIIRIAK